jgi:hypothetical protein
MTGRARRLYSQAAADRAKPDAHGAEEVIHHPALLQRVGHEDKHGAGDEDVTLHDAGHAV